MMIRVVRYLAVAAVLGITFILPVLADGVQQFVRYQAADGAYYGQLIGDEVHQLSAPPYEGVEKTGKVVNLTNVTLLPPSEPKNVIAVGLNFRSHAGMSGAAAPALFFKSYSSLIGHEAPIRIPKDAGQPHYEGEMVLVIGKRAKNVSAANAGTYIFGVTAGNDVSERSWQSSDLQWLRAKASDTFGPVGPTLVRGLNFNDLLLETKVNGEVVQSERTDHLIHNAAQIVSFTSRYITPYPGDLIFTGTPGSTRGLKAGDVVEITLEGVGTLRNPVLRD
jgi:2-keto-4-pentenoate hydratase/2-oxohepta-3-ene-1,7-dioic acid hydratase in catechol pathway